MCGRAAISYSAADIADACRAPPASRCLRTRRSRRVPRRLEVVRGQDEAQPGGQARRRGVAVRRPRRRRAAAGDAKFGIQRLATHCIWCDGGGVGQPRTGAGARGRTPLRRRGDAFAKGVTCRMEEDGGLFFLAAIYRGVAVCSRPTRARRALRERALVQRGGAGGHVPIYMDARAAARWLERRPTSAPRSRASRSSRRPFSRPPRAAPRPRQGWNDAEEAGSAKKPASP